MALPVRAEEVRHVLVLHSYHSGMSWVANIEKGIRDTLLVPPYKDLVLHIEYMDTKRHHSAEYYARIRNLLESKFKNIHLSLILSSDNNAFDFLLENRNDLFPDVPVVFCGVNDFSDDQIKGVKGITGVAEVMSSRETVESILKQLPETKSIYVINDYLKTGRAWESTIKRNLEPFRDRVSIEYNENLTIAGLRNKIHSLKSGSVVLLGVYYSDRDGKYVTYEKLGSILTKDSPVPVYCLLRFNLRDGVIGGKVISGYHQGVMMSEVARKVLSGEKTEDIPVVKIGANAFIFDWQSLDKYGISIDSLPEESVVLNEPFSFYEEYFYLVWSTVFVFVFMILLVIVLIKNVMALHKTRRDLGHSELKYRSIFDNAQEGIFQTSVEGRVMAANAAFAAIFGYDSPEEVTEVLDNVGKKLYLNEVDRNILLTAMTETGTLTGFEVKMKCKGGEIVWITMNARKTTDQNGKVIFEGSVVDITERKLNEQRIIQSEKMMSVGGLAAGMAHEINNPLAAIVGAVQNLQKRLASESKKNIMIAKECGTSFSAITEYLERRDCLKFLDGIYESGLRAATIVRGMLSFSRKSGSDFASHNLGSIVENALSLVMKDYDYNRNYDFKKIKIIKDFDAPNSWIKCDEVEIQQVVLNLLKNGAEAMGEKSYEEGGPCFVLRIHENRSMAVLEIEDNGPGMDEEVRKRILEPFYTTKSVGKGTGLGLSISYFIITRRHKGSMEVFSELGKGTRFVVRLPLYKD
ncbi:ATP-binding protein [Maridesulfovibrio sp.]|uniref:ATP-binding protein n=1 Tax=Maridesulfovibrio sp. TaxID=2795000 RepID=UPI002A188D77|nr:ATP-binding protein [Maridesulfovibrio sp.]